jgi:hypothetical protein
VLVEVKNVIAIESIPIIVVLADDDDMGMELSVELAMDIPEVLDGEPDMDMLAIFIIADSAPLKGLNVSLLWLK